MHLPDETLFGVKFAQVGVRVLSDDDPAPGVESVALLVDLGHAFTPVHEEGGRTRFGIAGDAQVGLQGTELRDFE